MPPLTIALPALLALFALALRLHGLADKPLWYDEILSLSRARLPFFKLVADALTHKHYPTYFLLLQPFASAHIDAWALRLPSAVFGAACVFLVTRIAIEIRGGLAGLVAGLLMALSPLEVQFGQEARPYAVISCLILVAVWGLVRIAAAPQTAALQWNRSGALRGPWAAYLLGTLAALVVENNAIPWLVASNIAFAIIVHRTRPARSGLLRNWIWTQVTITLVWLPAFITMISANRGAVASGLEWIPRSSFEDIRSVGQALYMFRVSDMMSFGLLPGPLPQFGVAIAALAAFGAWRLKTQSCVLAVIGIAFATMPMTIFLISIFQPMWLPRYLLWSTGPYFVMAGVGAASLPWRFARPLTVAIAAGGAICLWPYYSAETKSRWDQAASFLADYAGPNDVIVTEYPSVEVILAAFAEPRHFDSKFTVLAWNAQHHTPSLVADRDRTWALYGRVGQGAQESEEEFRRKWAVLGDPALQIRFGTHLLALRFDKSARPQQDISSAQLEPKAPATPRTAAP